MHINMPKGTEMAEIYLEEDEEYVEVNIPKCNLRLTIDVDGDIYIYSKNGMRMVTSMGELLV